MAFNAFLKIDFEASRVKFDGGLIPVGEWKEGVGLWRSDPAAPVGCLGRGEKSQLLGAELRRQSVCGWLAGYEGANDYERLPQDPTLGLIGSEKISDRGAALTCRLQAFETEMRA